MKLSVIIPCYNAETYLSACLDSVLGQGMRDFEVILIDDGSSDRTGEIALQYAKRDKRVRVIRQQNAGVSAARNAGLAIAEGEWVLFVDADDLLPPDALETLLAHARDGVDLVVSLHETFSESQNVQTVYPETRWMDKAGESRRRAAALRLIEGDTVLNIMCNKLHRRETLLREEMNLAEGVRIAEDALFNLEAVLCAREIAFCEQVTYRYRIHAASATQTRARSEFDTHLPWFTAMSDMLKRRGVFERYYAPFFSSVVLRIYKDGGVSGVMRDFSGKAKPLLMTDLCEAALSFRGRVLRMLCRTDLYAKVYPLLYPFEVAERKLREAAFALRVRRMKRG